MADPISRRQFNLSPFCDQCGKSRAHGSHVKCSKARKSLAEQGKLAQPTKRS